MFSRPPGWYPSSRETVSQQGIEPPATLFGLGTSPLSGSVGSSRTIPSYFECAYMSTTETKFGMFYTLTLL
jgi:hypothetical protein